MSRATARLHNLLNDPLANRGTAFTNAERQRLGLHGLLPPHVETLAQQAQRAWEAYRRKSDDLERHIYLRALQDTNEVLFYRLMLDHIAEMVPVIYTPVVAEACRQFSHIYRRPRGLILAYPLRRQLRALLGNRRRREVDAIVVTDGERVLGIGDQGVGGLGISIGKLALYTLLGGIDPARTLPIVLDVGTNNATLLGDPEYLGWRHERLDGAAYDAFVEDFISAVEAAMPRVLLQWEDFASAHAWPLLDRYRNRLLSFNDDIQGTAAVVLAAAAAAIAVAGSRFRDQRWIFFGAGSAALGVADYLCSAMVEDGLSPGEARRRVWMLDSAGLLHAGRGGLSREKLRYAQPGLPGQRFSLADVAAQVPATGLIGLSTMPGAFTAAVVAEMARKTARPIIFPLSNPTACSEADPADLMRWSQGRALVATGSPYPGYTQCNNAYIFPAVGLGTIAGGALRITDAMLIAAGRELARHSPARQDPNAPLLPNLEHVHALTLDVALAVARAAGTHSGEPPARLRARLRAARWAPAYPKPGAKFRGES